jgi:putative ABC transport system permease protein
MRGDNFGILNIDSHFQEVFNPKILAGRMFTLEDKPGGTQLVINRDACKKFGFDSPETAIGKFVMLRVNDYLSIPETPYLVCGVIEDFHQESPRRNIEPLLLLKDYRWKYEVGFVTVRFKNPGSGQAIISQLKDKWESYFPSDPFAFQYTSDNYQLQLKADEKLAGLSVIYTMLSILLAALGVYGLAANSIRKRVKEIGIRKVNGAKVYEILVMLNIDFVKWVAFAFVIAVPVAWYAMHRCGWIILPIKPV